MYPRKVYLLLMALMYAVTAAWLLTAPVSTSGSALDTVSSTANADTLFNELKNSALSRILKKGNFNWEKRPHSWNWGFEGNAAVIAYKCTGDVRFLDWLAATYDQLLAYRDTKLGRVDDVRRRVVDSWSSVLTVKHGWAISEHPRVTKRKFRTNEVTTAALMVLPALKFVELLRGNEELSKKYGEQADRFLDTAIAALSEFDDDYKVTPDGRGYYVMPHDGNVEALNHSHTVGADFAILYKLTGKDDYKQKTLELARMFRDSLRRESNGSYSWGYFPAISAEASSKSEALWKGRTTLMLPLAAYSRNIDFSDEDMKAFSKTFTENIYRGDMKFNIFISLSDEKPLELSNIKYDNRAQTLLGWIFLDRFDPQIRDILERAVVERPDLFPNGWFGSPAGTQAYAYRLCEVGEVSGY
jgi:hypothetical protein